MSSDDIQWPKRWDSKEGWPQQEESPLTKEPRLWSSLGTLLYRGYGQNNLSMRVERLGGPRGHLFGRSEESIKAQIWTYYKSNKSRPSVHTNQQWSSANSWLRARNSSLHQVCNELGLPGPLSYRTITVSEVKAKVFHHLKSQGSCPQVTASPEWKGIDGWLRRNEGVSLRIFCQNLGLDGYGMLSIDSIKDKLLAHHKKYGRRLSTKSTEGARYDKWLRSRHMSLTSIYNELGVAGGHKCDRTEKSIKVEVLAFYATHGRRPKISDEGWEATQVWLSARGSSLRKFCLKLSLPDTANYARTVDGVKHEVIAYVKKYGVCPSKRTDKTWASHAAWLWRNGYQLSALCDEVSNMRLSHA